MRKFSILAACCCASLATPAFGDWEQTHWGDKIDAVVSTVGQGIRVKEGGSGERVFDQNLKAERDGDFEGMPAVWQFYVDKAGGLSVVRVHPKDPVRDCPAFVRRALGRFGEPGKHGVDGPVGLTVERSTWADREANLAILMSEFKVVTTRACHVIWQPFGDGEPGPRG